MANSRVEYTIHDHLGSPRVILSDLNGDGTISTSNMEVLDRYVNYPFGMEAESHLLHGIPTTNEERYGSKERSAAAHAEILDYEARYYEPSIGRFMGVDPLASDFPSQSSYLYAYNNPVRMIDVDGLYGDENEANRQRDLAQAQGHKVVGDVYKSGDEWMFNTMEGDAFTGRFDKDFSQNSASWHSKVSSSSSIAGTATGAYGDFLVKGGKYRGASGNYYSYIGRKGWNQYTGTKAHMNKTLSKAKWAGRAAYGLGIVNIGVNTVQWQRGEISNVTYGIETTSSIIGTYTPPHISIPWTLGYELLGRHGVARIPWYQNQMKPWVRKNILGYED